MQPAVGRQRWIGYLALNACTVLWGSQHAVIKSLVVSTSLPSLVNAIRFTVAAIVTSSARMLYGSCCAAQSQQDAAALARPGFCGLLIGAAELALWQTISFTLQLIGLHWTTASRSAFLLYLNATMVPVVSTVLGERGIGLRTWMCVLFAVAGTLLLCNDGGKPNIGDLWSLGSAASSAMFIVRLTWAAKGRNAVTLSATTLAFTSVGCWAVAAVNAAQAGVSLSDEVVSAVVSNWRRLLYLSLAVSALASWLQVMGQQTVPPHESVVIYTLDPVYGALFAYILLGEELHALGWVGVGLVVCANLLRRLPWQQWCGVRPSELSLEALDVPEDSKRAPLLGTPKTPAWLNKWLQSREFWS